MAKKEKDMAGKRRIRRPAVWALCVIASAALCFTACGAADAEPTSVTEPEVSTESAAVTEQMSGTQQTDGTEYAEQISGYEVQTPIGTLFYPERWAQAIEVEQETDNGTFTAKFYGRLADEKVSLFTLYVGSEGQGYLMGSKEEQSVWIEFQPAEPSESWSEEDARQITEMQECVNDMMYQIYTLDGFEKSRPEN